MIFFFKLMDVNGYFFNLQLKTIPFLKFRHNFVLKGFVLSVVQYNLCLKNVCIAEAFSTRENYIFSFPRPVIHNFRLFSNILQAQTASIAFPKKSSCSIYFFQLLKIHSQPSFQCLNAFHCIRHMCAVKLI